MQHQQPQMVQHQQPQTTPALQRAHSGQQSFSQTTVTTSSSTQQSHGGHGQVQSPGYQQQAPAPFYVQQQSPQPLQYGQPLQLTAGTSPLLIANVNQQSQVQPQMAYAGQTNAYSPGPQGYPPQTPGPQQQMIPAGQPGGYATSPGYPQQGGMIQQQPYQYGQPAAGSPQAYQQGAQTPQYSGYSQHPQYDPAQAQAMVPASSAAMPPKEKRRKSSSSKKDRK